MYKFIVHPTFCWTHSCKHNFCCKVLTNEGVWQLLSGCRNALLLLDYVQTGRLLPHKRIWQYRLILLCSRLFTIGYNKIYMREKGYLYDIWQFEIRDRIGYACIYRETWRPFFGFHNLIYLPIRDFRQMLCAITASSYNALTWYELE